MWLELIILWKFPSLNCLNYRDQLKNLQKIHLAMQSKILVEDWFAGVMLASFPVSPPTHEPMIMARDHASLVPSLPAHAQAHAHGQGSHKKESYVYVQQCGGKSIKCLAVYVE